MGHLAQRRVTPRNVRTTLDHPDLRGLPIRLNKLLVPLSWKNVSSTVIVTPSALSQLMAERKRERDTLRIQGREK